MILGKKQFSDRANNCLDRQYPDVMIEPGNLQLWGWFIYMILFKKKKNYMTSLNLREIVWIQNLTFK